MPDKRFREIIVDVDQDWSTAYACASLPNVEVMHIIGLHVGEPLDLDHFEIIEFKFVQN